MLLVSANPCRIELVSRVGFLIKRVGILGVFAFVPATDVDHNGLVRLTPKCRSTMLRAAAMLALMVTQVAASAAEVDFQNDIVPLLTKSGCNAGACHGAAAGRGGLQTFVVRW